MFNTKQDSYSCTRISDFVGKFPYPLWKIKGCSMWAGQEKVLFVLTRVTKKENQEP